MSTAADVTFKDVVREACLSRDHFMEWSDSTGSLDAAMTQITAALGVSASERIEDIEREIVDGPNLPRRDWPAVAAAFDGGSAADISQAERFRIADSLTDRAQVEAYLDVFLTETKGRHRPAQDADDETARQAAIGVRGAAGRGADANRPAG